MTNHKEWPPVGMCCVVYPFDMGETLVCQRGINHSGPHKAIGIHCEYSWPLSYRFDMKFSEDFLRKAAEEDEQ